MGQLINLSANILNFPNLCCCCGQPGPTEKYAAIATRTTGKRVIKTTQKSWSFPICTKCVEWSSIEMNARKLRTGFFVLALLLLYLLVDAAFAYAAVTFFGAALVFFFWRKCREKADTAKPHAECDVRPALYLEWQGTVHKFRLTNSAFTSEFLRLNSKKLVG